MTTPLGKEEKPAACGIFLAGAVAAGLDAPWASAAPRTYGGTAQRQPLTPQGQHTQVLSFVQMFTEQLPSVRPMLAADVWVGHGPDLGRLTGRPSNRIHTEVLLSPWQGLGGE